MRPTGLLFLIIIPIISLQSNYLYAQDNSRIGLYEWKQAVVMEEVNLDGTPVKGDSAGSKLVVSLAGQKFRVISQLSGGAGYVIQILDYTIKNKNPESGTGALSYEPLANFYRYNYSGTAAEYASNAERANARVYEDKQRYFKVSEDQIDDLATRQGRGGLSLALGVINFPFKIRPQKDNKDFSGAFNFGAGIGLTLPHNNDAKFIWSILSGYSLSSIVLDETSVGNPDNLGNSNNFSALSLSWGAMVQYEAVQLGAFIGIDRISNSVHSEVDWVYQNKPWISVGFGLAIFSGEGGKASTPEEQK